jgi:hypothetical protein
MNKKPNAVTDVQSSVLWNIAVDSAIRSFNGEESEESFKKSILKFKSELRKLLNKERRSNERRN